MMGPRKGEAKLAGTGKYNEDNSKMGLLEQPEINDEEIKQGLERELAKLRGSLPEEWYDLLLVLDNGAKKHGPLTWLELKNPSLQHRANHASMSRHLAEAFCGIVKDRESGLHPLLHLACRALMQYTRYKRGIFTESDRKFIRDDS